MNKYIGSDFIHFTDPGRNRRPYFINFFWQKKRFRARVLYVCKGRALFYTQPYYNQNLKSLLFWTLFVKNNLNLGILVRFFFLIFISLSKWHIKKKFQKYLKCFKVKRGELLVSFWNSRLNSKLKLSLFSGW